MPQPFTLKDLRIWHWLQVLHNRTKAKRAKSVSARLYYNDLANHHIRAVQALNEVVPGTAETDLEQQTLNLFNKDN